MGLNTKICAGLREKSTVSKTCVKRPLLKRQKMVFKINYRLINAGQTYCGMLQVDHSTILSTFIKLSIVIKIFVLSIFERPFYTGYTVFEKKYLEVNSVTLWA